ncbi:MAG: DUF2834 domain-containing protein [Actinomycetota bacterium]
MSAALERPLLVATLLGFGALTLVAVIADGLPGGAIDAITFNWMSTQIYVDLVIAVVVICIWIYRDATRRGQNPWPWIIGAAIVGMFSPLVYLLLRTGHDNVD